MRSNSRRVLPLLAAIVGVLAFGAVSAQAQTINPAGESFSGLSDNTALSYTGFEISCDQAGADGFTDNPASNTAFLDDVWFGPDPPNDCSVNVGFATVDSIDVTVGPPNWELIAYHAVGGGDGYSNIKIPSGGEVVVDISLAGSPLCTLTVSGEQELVGPLGPSGHEHHSAFLDASEQVLTVNAEVGIVRTGSSLCGDASGTGTYTGDYDVTSTNPISIS